jgi:hypothetical protein
LLPKIVVNSLWCDVYKDLVKNSMNNPGYLFSREIYTQFYTLPKKLSLYPCAVISLFIPFNSFPNSLYYTITMKKRLAICPKCGFVSTDGKEKFCPNCGTKLITKCPNCGALIHHPLARFCPVCGDEYAKKNVERNKRR